MLHNETSPVLKAVQGFPFNFPKTHHEEKKNHEEKHDVTVIIIKKNHQENNAYNRRLKKIPMKYILKNFVALWPCHPKGTCSSW